MVFTIPKDNSQEKFLGIDISASLQDLHTKRQDAYL
jgi:hypothetical protein